MIFNYALLVQFMICTLIALLNGDYLKAVYWTGATLCTAGVTFS